MINIPSRMPIRDSARGVAKTPAPRTIMISVPDHYLCGLKHTRIEQIDDAADPACLTDHADVFPASTGALPAKFRHQYPQNIAITFSPYGKGKRIRRFIPHASTGGVGAPGVSIAAALGITMDRRVQRHTHIYLLQQRYEWKDVMKGEEKVRRLRARGRILYPLQRDSWT